jgi:hypothetical protein
MEKKCEYGKRKRKNYPSNKAWRENNRKVFESSKKKNYAKTREFAVNDGKIWLKMDERMITASGRPCDRILAKKLGRSVQAIQIRRSRLKHGTIWP